MVRFEIDHFENWWLWKMGHFKIDDFDIGSSRVGKFSKWPLFRRDRFRSGPFSSWSKSEWHILEVNHFFKRSLYHHIAVLKIGLWKWNFLVSRNFFSLILISEMDVKMNLRIITKNHAADSKIGSPLKIDFRADETRESHPIVWSRLKYFPKWPFLATVTTNFFVIPIC